jgi:putative ABC transport system ATP-binding protein
MLKVNNLVKTFQSGSGAVTAVNDVSFEVGDGLFAAIVGKSGSGKTTLLGLLGALDKPTSGDIQVGGQSVGRLSDRALIKYRRDRIGFVFQAYNLIPNLSALENVMLPMEFAGVPKAARKARAAELLDQVGINAEEQLRKPSRLSGGQQQRVAIARALANRPKLILADEPTGNLDSATGKLIVDLLHSLARNHKTTIVAVTHDEEIARQTDYTFSLADGKLVGQRRNHRAPAREPEARATEPVRTHTAKGLS